MKADRTKTQTRKAVLRDVIIVLALAAVALGLTMLLRNDSKLLTRDTLISQAYVTRQGKDGSCYIVDNSRERLLHLAKDGTCLWMADMPQGEVSAALYIDDIAVAPNGTVYVQVSDWDGMHIDRELILVYNQSGQLLRTGAEARYECATVNKHTRFGMQAENGSVTMLQAGDNVLNLVRVRASGTEELRSIPYSSAYTRVFDAEVRGSDIVILDKNGTIYHYSDSGVKPVYDASQDQTANRVPYRIALGEDGSICFTDIRDRSVRQVTDDPGQTLCLYEDTDALWATFGQDGVLLVTEPERVLIGTDGSTVLSEWHWSTQTEIMRIVALVLFIIGVLLAGHVLFRAVKLLSRIRLTATQRTSVLLMVCVVVAVALVCVKLLDGFLVSYQDKIQEELEVTAYTVANLVNGEDIIAVETSADFDSVHYGRLVSRMNTVFDADVPLYDEIYCNILRYDDQGRAWAIAYYDQSIGTYYPLGEGEAAEVMETVETRRTVWNGGTSLVSGVFCYVKVPVFLYDGTVAGVIEVGTETMVLDSMIGSVSRQLIMTLLILIMVIWLAVGELMNYSNAQEKYSKRLEQAGSKHGILPGHLIRLLVFIMFVAYNMTSSFLPVYILRSVDGWNFADREMMASLPITLNIFAIGTMALCCAGLLKRISIRTLTVFSAAFSVAGNLLMFLVPTYPCIVIGLALDGIGMGLVSNAVYVLLSRLKDEKERLDGFTIYNAACISGINFGMMVGSILAANFSQQIVFACVAALWLLVICVTVAVDKHTRSMTGEEETGEAAPSISLGRFLRGKGILSFMVLIQNPYIIFNSFAFYFVPLFCDELGMGETTVSLLLMVYSLFAVYLSDAITGAVDRLIGRRAMYLALALNICAVVLFAQLQTMGAMVAALVLMGLSASFGKSVQQNYFMELGSVKAYGEDKSIGLYNFTENIGESLGPVVFGKLAVFTPRSLGFAGFGGVIACLTAVHYFLSGRKDLNRSESNGKE